MFCHISLPLLAPTQNGFVFSNEEIFATAHRESTLEIAKVEVNKFPYKVQFAGATAGAQSTRGTDPAIAEQATRHTVRKPVKSAELFGKRA
jgi:hypothetical protein